MLPVAYRDELERIVFFNPEQGRVTASLLDSVRRYGVPSIVEDGSLLRFRVPAFGTIQSLFALDESEQPVRLAGVVMFVRETADTMRLLHVAIHEDYAGGGDRADAWVAFALPARGPSPAATNRVGARLVEAKDQSGRLGSKAGTFSSLLGALLYC
jgi:hypothetical protein